VGPALGRQTATNIAWHSHSEQQLGTTEKDLHQPVGKTDQQNMHVSTTNK
jgi:hypothetical protein